MDSMQQELETLVFRKKNHWEETVLLRSSATVHSLARLYKLKPSSITVTQDGGLNITLMGEPDGSGGWKPFHFPAGCAKYIVDGETGEQEGTIMDQQQQQNGVAVSPQQHLLHNQSPVAAPLVRQNNGIDSFLLQNSTSLLSGKRNRKAMEPLQVPVTRARYKRAVKAEDAKLKPGDDDDDVVQVQLDKNNASYSEILKQLHDKWQDGVTYKLTDASGQPLTTNEKSFFHSRAYNSTKIRAVNTHEFNLRKSVKRMQEEFQEEIDHRATLSWELYAEEHGKWKKQKLWPSEKEVLMKEKHTLEREKETLEQKLAAQRNTMQKCKEVFECSCCKDIMGSTAESRPVVCNLCCSIVGCGSCVQHYNDSRRALVDEGEEDEMLLLAKCPKCNNLGVSFESLKGMDELLDWMRKLCFLLFKQN